MKSNVPDKILLLQKIKKGSCKESERAEKKKKISRLLITVTVLGSAGPIRFMVNEDDPVSWVIDAALKSYAREGRLPILGSNASHFFLYCNANFEAMSPVEAIGSRGGRSFVLCKKESHPQPQATEEDGATNLMARKPTTGSRGTWRAWLKKNFRFKVQSH